MVEGKKPKKGPKPFSWALPKWRTLGAHHRPVPLRRAAGFAGVFVIRRNTVGPDDGRVVFVGRSSEDPVHDTDLRDAILRHVDLGVGPKPLEPCVTRGVAEVCFKKVRNVRRLDEALKRFRVLLGLDCDHVDPHGAPCLLARSHAGRDHLCVVADGQPVYSLLDVRLCGTCRGARRVPAKGPDDGGLTTVACPACDPGQGANP